MSPCRNTSRESFSTEARRRPAAGVCQLIEHDHAAAARRKPMADEPAAEKAGTTGDEDGFHSTCSREVVSCYGFSRPNPIVYYLRTKDD